MQDSRVFGNLGKWELAIRHLTVTAQEPAWLQLSELLPHGRILMQASLQ